MSQTRSSRPNAEIKIFAISGNTVQVDGGGRFQSIVDRQNEWSNQRPAGLAAWIQGASNMNNKYFRAGARACLPILLALTLVACGSSNNPATPPTSSAFLYSTSVTGITAFPVNTSTGTLGPGTLVASGFTSIAFLANMVSDPAGKFLFVCGLADSSIEGFSISAMTGALTPVSGSPFPIQGFGLGNLLMDPAGKFLYAATTTGVTAFTVNGTSGTLSAIVGSPFSDGSVRRASVVDPSGKFLYASGNTTQITISVFTIDSASGALTPIAGSPSNRL